jgi:Arc/MetJ-type ribon-helix-helix transcriptional regulator
MPRASTKSMSSAPKPQDEKITINLGCVDLGQIDLLVQEGFYANRTDLIRTAVRNLLAVHADSVRQAAARKTLSLGALYLTKADLQARKAAGETLDIRVLGLATIAPDVSPDLALATISSLTVLGALHASPAVKKALSQRIR